MKYSLCILLFILLWNCNISKPETPSAENIINESIKVSGGQLLDASILHFDFRNMHYTAIRNNGNFELMREFVDSSSSHISNVKDVLSNSGFQRFVDGIAIQVADSMVVKYSASVNSAHYFSVLPFGLNNKAVNKELRNTTVINDEEYHTIKVTFEQDGGGEDFEDVFMYWVHTETDKINYLAYSYNESDGKGVRFRQAYNERYIEGVRFVDYNNYKPEESFINLTELPQLFELGKLKLLSKIELENLTFN
ncbi:hypothetical protein SAMN04515667_2373 [Formosa sp. Hel1_31_208]|uniref:DUF6503 family protein n=1 Tax=Formosa sp. Hel1_31_208 TaxID=1798225 RepID=UPI00087BA30B|nr:DUF6503 family protein [Formosa sp. Hel1_31_208]SDS52605.1 hypothetical protein SAMN04515667_2373 [Formosa sp. Hel1_31_208]